jgi:hypothetical protein
MPIFSWNAGPASDVVSHRLWVYFLVTLPLTIITLVSWRIWSQQSNKIYEQRREERKQTRLENEAREAEDGAMATEMDLMRNFLGR